MENVLLIILVALLAGLFIAIGAIIWIGHRYLRLKEAERSEVRESENLEPVKSSPKPKLRIQRKGADILKALRSQGGGGLYCVDHPDMIAVGKCAISGESYCEHCLTSQSDVKLAKKYLDLYLESDWEEVLMLHNEDISQDAAERIVKVKNVLWEKEGRPMIVQGHYKINVDSDEIEGYTVVIARSEDLDFIRKELSFIQISDQKNDKESDKERGWH